MAKKRGRTPRFRDVACPNTRCRVFGQLGSGMVVSNGTYFVGSARVRKFICRHCGKVFNSRARTPFRWLHTPQRKVLMALKLLVKGLSLRGTAEVLEVKLDTVRNWLRKVAQETFTYDVVSMRSSLQSGLSMNLGTDVLQASMRDRLAHSVSEKPL